MTTDLAAGKGTCSDQAGDVRNDPKGFQEPPALVVPTGLLDLREVTVETHVDRRLTVTIRVDDSLISTLDTSRHGDTWGRKWSYILDLTNETTDGYLVEILMSEGYGNYPVNASAFMTWAGRAGMDEGEVEVEGAVITARFPPHKIQSPLTFAASAQDDPGANGDKCRAATLSYPPG